MGYIISGINNALLPPLTLGYIYLPALLGISLTSIIAAKYGAHIAHHVSEKILKRMMASMMLLNIFLYGFFMIIELSEFFNNPSLIEIGPLKIQYYAVTWLLSAVFIYLFLKSNQIMIELGLNHEKVNDLVFLYGLFIGAMCGGRVGYMLFYGTEQLINNPISLFYIWQGGLSFHGGLAGVVVSFLVFAKKNNLSFLRLMDGAALSMPIGLGLVRIGNFLNGELYGKEQMEIGALFFLQIHLDS